MRVKLQCAGRGELESTPDPAGWFSGICSRLRSSDRNVFGVKRSNSPIGFRSNAQRSPRPHSATSAFLALLPSPAVFHSQDLCTPDIAVHSVHFGEFRERRGSFVHSLTTSATGIDANPCLLVRLGEFGGSTSNGPGLRKASDPATPTPTLPRGEMLRHSAVCGRGRVQIVIAMKPPSTTRFSPVMKLPAFGEASRTIAPASSCGSP